VSLYPLGTKQKAINAETPMAFLLFFYVEFFISFSLPFSSCGFSWYFYSTYKISLWCQKSKPSSNQ